MTFEVEDESLVLISSEGRSEDLPALLDEYAIVEEECKKEENEEKEEDESNGETNEVNDQNVKVIEYVLIIW